VRVLVCGGRYFEDWDLLDRTLTEWYHTQGTEPLLIHGAARGADQMAGNWATVNSCPMQVFPADWDKHGRAAGILRNIQMLEEGKPDLVFAFPGGRGTAHMKKIAREKGVEVREVKP
jgi:hypothetical protein